MLKPVLQFAAVGFVGVLLWKLAGAFLLPLIFLVIAIVFEAFLQIPTQPSFPSIRE